MLNWLKNAFESIFGAAPTPAAVQKEEKVAKKRAATDKAVEKAAAKKAPAKKAAKKATKKVK